MIEVVSAGCVVFNEKNEILLVSCKPNEPQFCGMTKGMPDGNDNNKLENTARREVFEETGVTLKAEILPLGWDSYKPVYNGEEVQKSVCWYYAEVDENIPVAEKDCEHQDVLWVGFLVALAMISHASEKEFLMKAIKYRMSVQVYKPL
jgi:8-oxo-dGTP pyrophosphatase MutT (NUDIX family)